MRNNAFQAESMMRYAVDFSGSFQVHGVGSSTSYSGSIGGVQHDGFLQQSAMSQVANTQWSSAAFAVTLLGDTRWKDTTARAKVRLGTLPGYQWMPAPAVELKVCVNGSARQQWTLSADGLSILTADGRHLSVQGGHDTGVNGVYDEKEASDPEPAGRVGGTSYAQRVVVTQTANKPSERERKRGPGAWRVISTTSKSSPLLDHSHGGGGSGGSGGSGTTFDHSHGGVGAGHAVVIASIGLPGQCMSLLDGSVIILRPCGDASVQWAMTHGTLSHAGRCLTAPGPPSQASDGSNNGMHLSTAGEANATANSNANGTLCIKHSSPSDDRWQPVCRPFAGVCARVSQMSPDLGGVIGYCLTLDHTGTWRLSYALGSTGETTLATGSVGVRVSLAAWHELDLRVKGAAVITASINGSVVAHYTDHGSGNGERIGSVGSGPNRNNQSGLVAMVATTIRGISFNDLYIG